VESDCGGIVVSLGLSVAGPGVSVGVKPISNFEASPDA